MRRAEAVKPAEPVRRFRCCGLVVIKFLTRSCPAWLCTVRNSDATGGIVRNGGVRFRYHHCRR
jgi:hypothetical protein